MEIIHKRRQTVSLLVLSLCTIQRSKVFLLTSLWQGGGTFLIEIISTIKVKFFRISPPRKKLKGLMKTEGSDHHEIGNNTEKTIKIEMVNSHANDSGKIVVAFFFSFFLLSLTKIILSLGQTKPTEDRDFCNILFFVEFKRRTNENKQHDIL